MFFHKGNIFGLGVVDLDDQLHMLRILSIGFPESIDRCPGVLPAGIAVAVEHHQHQEVILVQSEIRPCQLFVIGCFHSIQDRNDRLVRFLPHGPCRKLRRGPHFIHIVKQRLPVIRQGLQFPLENAHIVMPVKMALREGAQRVLPLRRVDVHHIDRVFVFNRQPVIKCFILLRQVRNKIQVQQRMGDIALFQRTGIKLGTLSQSDLRFEQAVKVDPVRIPARFIRLGYLCFPDHALLQRLADHMPDIRRNHFLKPHVR